MDLNPIKLLQLKNKWSEFQQAHPKFVPFLRAASSRMEEGSIFSVTVTSPDGQVIETNLKLSASDIEMMREVAGITQNITK